MDFGESLKVEPFRLADGFDMSNERTIGIKHEGGFMGRGTVREAGLEEEKSSVLVFLKLNRGVK